MSQYGATWLQEFLSLWNRQHACSCPRRFSLKQVHIVKTHYMGLHTAFPVLCWLQSRIL